MKKRNLLIVSIVCFLIAGFAAVGMTETTFVITTGDNEVSSIDQVAVAITYDAEGKTIAELKQEYQDLQAYKAVLVEKGANIDAKIAGLQAEKALLTTEYQAANARVQALKDLRDAILAAAAEVELTEPNE